MFHKIAYDMFYIYLFSSGTKFGTKEGMDIADKTGNFGEL